MHVFGVPAQVGDKPGCTGTGDGNRLKSSYGLWSAHQLRGNRPCFRIVCKNSFFFLRKRVNNQGTELIAEQRVSIPHCMKPTRYFVTLRVLRNLQVHGKNYT